MLFKCQTHAEGIDISPHYPAASCIRGSVPPLPQNPQPPTAKLTDVKVEQPGRHTVLCKGTQDLPGRAFKIPKYYDLFQSVGARKLKSRGGAEGLF